MKEKKLRLWLIWPLKIADVLGVPLDYLAGKTDAEPDKTILDKVVSFQKLPDEDKGHIMYST